MNSLLKQLRKKEKEKERNKETREMLQDNKFINTWKIIKEANESEPWTNFDTYEKYITQTEKQLIAQILKAKEYFAKELIRIIVKNWKYEYPREQFEETEENITDLIIKEHDNFELSDLKARIKLAKTDKLGISTHIQPLTGYEVKLTEAKLPFNKSDKPTNISPFNGPLFNQLTLIEHLEESLYIRIAANKKN
ncbi:22375_t:CDS:2 [Gigaspora margarita]|uniref:22375_t:CDS:1 n=1 Tax=Gigaspora margarita TaxID=4874 RepID=A0ABN7UP77_GIGMA|nr:22375_t:CDS:2 [Gigaspora margarita]